MSLMIFSLYLNHKELHMCYLSEPEISFLFHSSIMGFVILAIIIEIVPVTTYMTHLKA